MIRLKEEHGKITLGLWFRLWVHWWQRSGIGARVGTALGDGNQYTTRPEDA